MNMQTATPGMRAPIEAPIGRVVLLEDRALVERRANLSLPAGTHRLQVAAVSPVLADRSLAVRAAAGVRIDDARVKRSWSIGVKEQPADGAALREEAETLAAALVAEEGSQQLTAEHRVLLEQAVALYFVGLNREMPFAASFAKEWREGVARLFADVRAADEGAHRSRCALQELQGRIAALRLRQAELGRIDHVLTAALELDVTVLAVGEQSLRIGYVVPCALWRPVHRARQSGERLRFECEGAVWQATGEDWQDVELLFSTSRSTQRSEPPVLSDDLVTVQPKTDKRLVVGVREQAIATTGEGGEAPGDVELPSVDDGGETRLLPSAGRATIAGDGRMRRIPIFSFETGAELERLARPERSGLVHLQSRQSNTSPSPILAGPVELLRDCGLVGRGEVGFVAPGEKFLLGFGGDPALRVKRLTDEEREVAKLTGRQTLKRTVRLFLSNLGSSEATFALEERVPVSELEQVTVTLDKEKTKPLTRADDNGIVRWQVTLAPHATDKVVLAYTLSAGSDVQGL
jgi:uncharacterized protein (TIGR02231 family)